MSDSHHHPPRRRSRRRFLQTAPALGLAAAALPQHDVQASQRPTASAIPAAADGRALYQRLGVRPLINGRGTLTIIGGSMELPAVREAKSLANQHYAHLDEYAEGLYNGQAVRRGELIGYVGTTGYARGWPHLHFEAGRLARPGSLAASPVNPYDFLLGRNPLPRPLWTVADTIALPPEPAVPPLLPPG